MYLSVVSKNAVLRTVVLLGAAVILGCGDKSPPAGSAAGPNGASVQNAPAAAQSDAKGSQHLLTAEPQGAKGVIEARKEIKDGDDVVVVGRIGGDVKPWVEGRASFVIVDKSLVPCNESGDDGCETPWDYCCTPSEELTAAKAAIKFVDDKGQTVATDARELLGVKELQTVVVEGKAKRDEAGNLTVLASGLFVKR